MTLDAMGCQKAIISKILERGADYLVTLKANQGKIFAAVRDQIAINLVRRHNSSRNSLRGRRKIAAWNHQYMRQVLTGIFHA